MARAFAILLLLVFLGCTRAPELPELHPHESGKLVLGKHLGASDVRKLFLSLNKNGQLDALKPLFQAPSDESLREIARLLDTYVYQAAGIPGKLPELIDLRIRENAFSRWHRWSAHAIKEDQYPLLADSALFLMSARQFPQLANHDVAFISPQIAALVAKLSADKSYREKSKWKKAAVVSSSVLFKDLTNFLNDPKLTTSLVKIGDSIQRAGLGRIFLEALSQIRTQYRHEENGPIAFEGLAHGLAKLLLNSPDNLDSVRYNQLDLLLYLGAQSNRPTDGLFLSVANAIDEKPDIFFSFAKQLIHPLIVQGLHRSLQRNLKEEVFWSALLQDPSGTTGELQKKVLQAISKIRGFDGTFLNVDPFPSELRTHLPSFVIASWFEQIVRENAAELKRGLASKTIWNTQVGSATLKMEFQSRDATGMVSYPQHDRMIAFGIPVEVVERLELYLRNGFIKDLYYEISTEEGPLGSALKTALEQSNETLALGEAGTFLNALAAYIASPDQQILSSLDSENIFDSIHRHLSVTSLANARRFKELLFDRFQLGLTPWEGPDGMSATLGPLVGNDPKHLALLRTLVTSSQPLVSFDTPVGDGLPSPFESYFVFAQNFPATCGPHCPLRALGGVFTFLSESQFFSLEGKEGSGFAPKYPAFYSWVEQGEPFARALHLLSLLDSTPGAELISEQSTLLTALQRAFAKSASDTESGLKLHLDLAKSFFSHKPQGALACLDWLRKQKWPMMGLENFSSAERLWFYQLVRSGDFAVLWRFWAEHFDREKALELVKTLQSLQEKGALRQVFRLFTHLSNTRLQEIGDLLLQWDSSGELSAFLAGAHTLLHSLIHAGGAPDA